VSDPADPEFVRSFEHETWTRCAGAYLDGFAGLTMPAVPLLVDAAGIEAGDRVLEIGSGPGHIAGALSDLGAKVTGIDFSKAMVDVASRRFPEIEFLEADAESLPFEEKAFDAVVSSFVVHHLARPEKVFSEVRRVLEPGKRFAFAVVAAPEAQSSIGAFFAAVAEHHSADELPHGPLFGVTDLAVYESMLASMGLADCKFEFREISWRSPSIEPVLKSFWQWGNMAELPADLQARIEETTRRNLEQYEVDGGYSLPHEALIGSAARP
jgi:ubiquinone/menaquinone biosynthesis C-methylase UbiE